MSTREFEVSERIRAYAERCNPMAYFVPGYMSQSDAGYLSARTAERARYERDRGARTWADVCATIDAGMPAGWSKGSFEHTGGGCYALVWRYEALAAECDGPAVYVTHEDDVFSGDDQPEHFTESTMLVGGYVREDDPDTAEMSYPPYAGLAAAVTAAAAAVTPR